MKRAIFQLLIAVAAYALSGLRLIQPDEQGVVRRFGAVHGAPREPGAHLFLPWGLDRVDRLKPREVKSVNVGGRNLAGGASGTESFQFLTGDHNLVNVRAVVQYTVKDPASHLFRTEEVERLIASAAESALSKGLAEQSVDWALVSGKRELGITAAHNVQTLADRYDLGITVRSLEVTGVEPPAEVADAFDKAVTALRRREQAVNEARGYSNRLAAQAQGDAQRLLDEGNSAKDRAIRRAQGEAERFEKLSAGYEQSPRLTAVRMYLETMAEVFPRLRSKLVLATGDDVDISVFGKERP